MNEPPADSFYLDEEPLKKAILKGYFGERVAPLEPEPLIANLRDLLSGPPPGEIEVNDYYFESDPERSLPAFFRGLEAENSGLSALIAEPLLSMVEDEQGGASTPNWIVSISSLAGSIALKARISEAAAAALLAGLLIAIARLGPTRARGLYDLSRQ